VRATPAVLAKLAAYVVSMAENAPFDHKQSTVS
jgi:hypothetical protein